MAEKQPPEWVGDKWQCSDMPADTAKYVYICCPTGYKRVSRRSMQGVSHKGYRVGQFCNEGISGRGGRRGKERDLVDCGPRPDGDVVCCPEIHRWVQFKGPDSCPMIEGRGGIDPELLMRVGAFPKQSKSQTGKLIGIGAGVLLLSGVMLYFIAQN